MVTGRSTSSPTPRESIKLRLPGYVTRSLGSQMWRKHVHTSVYVALLLEEPCSDHNIATVRTLRTACSAWQTYGWGGGPIASIRKRISSLPLYPKLGERTTSQLKTQQDISWTRTHPVSSTSAKVSEVKVKVSVVTSPGTSDTRSKSTRLFNGTGCGALLRMADPAEWNAMTTSSPSREPVFLTVHITCSSFVSLHWGVAHLQRVGENKADTRFIVHTEHLATQNDKGAITFTHAWDGQRAPRKWE